MSDVDTCSNPLYLWRAGSRHHPETVRNVGAYIDAPYRGEDCQQCPLVTKRSLAEVTRRSGQFLDEA